jgi:curli biogenesis system outer membrane secretion channel CsgG
MIKKHGLKGEIVLIACTLTIQSAFAGNFDDGVNSFQNQDYNKAVEYFQKATAQSPDDPEPHKWLAKCYSELFMVEQSLKEMDLVKKLEDTKAYNKRKVVEEEPKKEEPVAAEKPATVNIIINNSNSAGTGKYTGKKKIKIAVLEFNYKYPYYEYTYERKNKFTQTITEYLTSDLLDSGINMLERSQIDEVIKELKFENSEYVLSSTAKKIGKLYGLDYLLVGHVLDFSRDKKHLYNPKQSTITKKETSIRLNARLINVETGEIEFSKVLFDTDENMSYDFNEFTDIQMEDSLMASVSKRISREIVNKLNIKFANLK